MAGYTPVFDSVYDGTLCGKWPTLPVWLSILPMADKNGQIDLTYQAISARTGWPLELLKQGIAELMAPDPESRTPENEGRRLELIDAQNRHWGWRVINHTPYRNKARKAAYDADRTASGADADRKRHERAAAIVPTCPDASRLIPPSDSDSDSNTDKNKHSEACARSAPRETEDEIRVWVLEIKATYPKAPRETWMTAEHSLRNLLLHPDESMQGILDGVKRYARYCNATQRIVSNPSNWFGAADRPWRQDWEVPNQRAQKAAPNKDAAWAEAKSRAAAINFREPDPSESPESYMTAIKNAESGPRGPLATGISALAKKIGGHR